MKKLLIRLAVIAICLALAGLVVWAGGQGGITIAGYPALLLCAGLAFVVQWLVFVPSYIFQTEHYYDLTGSLTYIAVVSLALIYGTNSLSQPFDPRSIILAVLIFIWAGRLGSFLFRRVKRDGKDGRFDAIKVDPMRFFVTWTLQGLWVFLTLACTLAAMTTQKPQALSWVAGLGIGLWLLGFVLEAVADAQKSAFRQDPANRGRFINTGLWAWSRHPNYFGEILLWTGIAVIAAPVLVGWQWLTLISPFFVAFLLMRVSGVPLLEQRADAKWGEDTEYQQYKERTSVLVPMPPRPSE